jgi:hypothetical protein
LSRRLSLEKKRPRKKIREAEKKEKVDITNNSKKKV